MKSGEVEAKTPAPFSAAATPTQVWEARVKRDRDETCSDRGCGRYLKERGSGRISPKAARTYTSFATAKMTQVNPEKCHRGSGRCNVKFMESVNTENSSIA